MPTPLKSPAVQPSTLGIIAGNGTLPVLLAQACIAQKRPYFLIGLTEAADARALAPFPHAMLRIGAAGEIVARLKHAGVEELVLAGGVKRPSLASLKPDAAGAKLLTRLGMKLLAGDDALLKAIVQFFEEEGFRVVGADAVLNSLLATEGLIAGPQPDAQAQEDVAIGLKAARELGALDIGQAAIVENGAVLGVEAAEGTDDLIARCTPLQQAERRAVLVKAKKPGQEARADLPSIGPATIARLQAAGMLGVAVEAGGALLLEREELVRAADAAGIFIFGA